MLYRTACARALRDQAFALSKCLTASLGSARSLPEEKHRSHPIAPSLATPAAFLGNGPDWVRLEHPYLDVVEFSQTASIHWPETLAKQD